MHMEVQFICLSRYGIRRKLIFDYVIFTDTSNRACGDTIYMPFTAIALEGNLNLII